MLGRLVKNAIGGTNQIRAIIQIWLIIWRIFTDTTRERRERSLAPDDSQRGRLPQLSDDMVLNINIGKRNILRALLPVLICILHNAFRRALYGLQVILSLRFPPSHPPLVTLTLGSFPFSYSPPQSLSLFSAHTLAHTSTQNSLICSNTTLPHCSVHDLCRSARGQYLPDYHSPCVTAWQLVKWIQKAKSGSQFAC